jgi:hypothetical protein
MVEKFHYYYYYSRKYFCSINLFISLHSLSNQNEERLQSNYYSKDSKSTIKASTTIFSNTTIIAKIIVLSIFSIPILFASNPLKPSYFTFTSIASSIS